MKHTLNSANHKSLVSTCIFFHEGHSSVKLVLMISPIPLAAGCEGKNLQTIQVNSYEVYIKYAEITENTYEYTYPCPSRYKVFLPPLLCVSDATIVSPDPGVCAPSE